MAPQPTSGPGAPYTEGVTMRLQLMSWPEVERYLEDSEGVIVPIGATEQHGPNGLIGTDAICAETLVTCPSLLYQSLC